MFTIFLDEDFAMKIAIPEVFEKTQHRYCQFYVTRTWKHELDKLYMTHKGLKTEPESLINYPLAQAVLRLHGKNWWICIHYMIIQRSLLYGKNGKCGC
jgi:hypothetical protein